MAEPTVEELRAQLAKAEQKKADREAFDRAVNEKAKSTFSDLHAAMLEMEKTRHEKSLADINAMFELPSPEGKNERAVPAAFKDTEQK